VGGKITYRHPIRQQLLYPAVPEKLARLRFFMSCEHSEADIRTAVSTLAAELAAIS
jgi:7-keto-8-aminopelargonate synthetase-like enzyme